ncbi:hypothetical protein [Candidatus Laterigemmans baculatus]|uniref:hypothetical protein n=1 Tax=Candidatus Laterigemmans baculatus TaxID=2770505 RepID=UPI0013DC4F35|nr:hypothetical protein [Candidatus Laterigemmans baculatus]
MGRGYTQFSFPDTEAEDEYALYSAFLNYRMPDGKLLHVRQTECWCPKCNRIAMAERVETLAELEDEIERLRNPDEDESRMIKFIGKPISERIAELELRTKWRRNRISPAKCLHCGSTQVIPIPRKDEFKHPKTGERVVVVSRGFMSTDQWHAEYTPEGDVVSSSYR